MDGIILVNKPKDWTSFDVCAKLRNLSRTKKVGHSGTLDPFATGILPVFFGKATKSIKYFLEGDKGYVAEMRLGISTDTMDCTGRPISNFQSLEKLGTRFPISNFKSLISNDKAIKGIFEKYTGKIKQKPPMFSAKKVNGKKLYELARKGIEIEREDKEITIHSLKLLEIIEPDKVSFEVICSKGTYVRVLASDIGDDLGRGAHLTKLERFYSHPFHISQALTMEHLINLAKIGELESVLLKPEDFIAILVKNNY
ncbi:tRNA pseudouridine(55) synthase TruB [candidate division WOR-1 bacterium RIFOXYC2_FULL_37_10]|uniref:tRNA pseudouridine synthase B n=1 Tax=candidate division WOR-1 bacterium RIFOXYB2_FULL_37_13 TaxID=1802579 RepID=A0A1F4SQ46_UNCSA|nr:MAG: tRNA pseudouridine(55) synthase TruB [candidate division WOR-1 bacterium RIFOXYA2_FULL_37_7]OGC22529.1 MAG: tRNA pseudouridine(55) synthase TruB [candidate division WOR-1 bacterium RIFOXYB2_FULL_37_13]OGC34920.1 MAG: tRNA pseudouridine(55) synthase TruB [candidate division WOR-1 bacterium RIFOXYC2_FULL_37_10]